jgi:hypothetical protein
LSHEQQRGGQAQRRALAECSVVHDHAPRLIHRTTSKRIIIPAAPMAKIADDGPYFRYQIVEAMAIP